MKFFLATRRAFWGSYLLISVCSSCLTLRHRQLTPELPLTQSEPKSTRLFVNFQLQDLSESGRRTEYPQSGQPHERFHEYFVNALNGQGFEVTPDALTADAIIETKLTRRGHSCRYAGFAIKCANLELVQLLTLSLLPVSLTETDVLETRIHVGSKVIGTLTHEDAYDTWIHFLLLPLAPIEIFRLSHLNNVKNIMALQAREMVLTIGGLDGKQVSASKRRF